ncbi:hypothetical protein [Porphyromonas endodontalis]|uniref:hypothetical protein n=1 Tax=Porphyromonas endodontalis TaxID=28124 RepID=UPI0023F31E31|nr:hypothetical protein [Porphyromonas endodontalis]
MKMKSRAFCIAFAWVFLLSTTSLFAQDAAGAKGKNQRGGLSRWPTSVVDVSYERGILYSDYRLGRTAALHTQLDGFRVQYSLFPHFAKEGGDWLGLYVALSEYTRRAENDPSSLSALSGFYGGLTTKLYLHNRWKVRVSWVQNVGAVLTNFSFGVGSATPFAKSKWGVGLQEAIKYDYIFSSGAAFGVKGYIDYSHLFRNSSFSGFTVNPQHVTSLGIAASFSF